LEQKESKRRKRICAVHAVANGIAVALSAVPDAVFSEKVLGDG
jgi:phosphotransferase system IIA component